MSELSVKVAAEHGVAWIGGSGQHEIFGCTCGHRSTNDDEDDPFSAAHNRHVAEAMEAAVRETIAAERLAWLAGAVREAVSNAPRQSTEVNLATAYWDGYRAAGHEIADLIEEPAFAAKIAKGES